MHYAVKILKHYLTLAVESASPLDSDMHSELKMMTEAFDELFGRSHTHEERPDADAQELADIADVLRAAHSPWADLVEGVCWLAAKTKENKKAWRKREQELCGQARESLQKLADITYLLTPHQNPDFDPIARIKELLANEKLGKPHNNVLCQIADLLDKTGAPFGTSVKRVEWLVKHDARQIVRSHNIEKSLDDIKYLRGCPLSVRVNSLAKDYTLALERLKCDTDPTSYDECMDMLDNVDAPPGSLASRVRAVVAEREEIHKALDDAWACPAPYIPLLDRVRKPVKKYRRLRVRHEHSQGVASDIKYRKRIEEMLDGVGVPPNKSVVSRIGSLVNLHKVIRDQAAKAVGRITQVHKVLNSHGVPGNSDLANRVEAALPDYEALAQKIENLDTEVPIHGASDALCCAANIVRNWGR